MLNWSFKRPARLALVCSKLMLDCSRRTSNNYLKRHGSVLVRPESSSSAKRWAVHLRIELPWATCRVGCIRSPDWVLFYSLTFPPTVCSNPCERLALCSLLCHFQVCRYAQKNRHQTKTNMMNTNAPIGPYYTLSAIVQASKCSHCIFLPASIATPN
jgi:hypothetical protein